MRGNLESGAASVNIALEILRRLAHFWVVVLRPLSDSFLYHCARDGDENDGHYDNDDVHGHSVLLSSASKRAPHLAVTVFYITYSIKVKPGVIDVLS